MKLVKGTVKTMRSELERQLGVRVPVRHPLISGLVRHAANTLTWTVKGHDGVTAYHRVLGKPFRTRLMTFGEQCRYKLRSHKPNNSFGDGGTFHVGTYVGVGRRTGQYMIHRGHGIEYARTVLWFPSRTNGTRTSWRRFGPRRGPCKSRRRLRLRSKAKRISRNWTRRASS